MAIADVYDALISKRIYKEAMSHEKAMQLSLKAKALTSIRHGGRFC